MKKSQIAHIMAIMLDTCSDCPLEYICSESAKTCSGVWEKFLTTKVEPGYFIKREDIDVREK